MKKEDNIKREYTDKEEDEIIGKRENLMSERDETNPEEKVKREIEKDADQAPYEDDYMPDSPRHGVISSRPDLFEEDVERLVGAGTVSEPTDQYDEANMEEDEILD